MSGGARFAIFILVALATFVLILRAVLRARPQRPGWRRVLATAVAVVAGGMLFAKVGQNGGLPWWIYYTVPLLATLIVPPAVFGMSRREAIAYLVLTFMSSPVIHLLFSFLLGWKEYLPVIDVPAFWEL